jgi:nitrate/TMAO reductase-like tetraheme cytochrome c subunit
MSIKNKRRIKYAAFILTPAILIAMIALVVATSSGSTADADAAPCAACHNDSTLIAGKATQWADSTHGTGEAYLRGTSASCAGCHSGGGFSLRIAAGQDPGQVTAGDPNPTRQDCRACHQIHTSYTGVDWALETTSAVNLFKIPGATFDGGDGNLCAQCHQPRSNAPVPSGGQITGISSHWGPHHGPQSSVMLGVGGFTASPGAPASHYNLLGDTCVDCHMGGAGANANHSYEPQLSVCKGCHTTATSFDVDGFQTHVQAQADAIKDELVSLGALSCSVDSEGVESCAPSVTSAPENVGKALWNWDIIAKDDGSKGVHNPAYVQAMLDEAAAQLGITLP